MSAHILENVCAYFLGLLTYVRTYVCFQFEKIMSFVFSGVYIFYYRACNLKPRARKSAYISFARKIYILNFVGTFKYFSKNIFQTKYLEIFFYKFMEYILNSNFVSQL